MLNLDHVTKIQLFHSELTKPLTDRDWGSTMKPITDYAPAIENGVYTSTSDITSDSKAYWPGTSTQIYNWDRQYYGNMTIQTAIQQSRNVPAVKALESVGLNKAKSFLEGLGIYYPQLYASMLSQVQQVIPMKIRSKQRKCFCLCRIR